MRFKPKRLRLIYGEILTHLLCVAHTHTNTHTPHIYNSSPIKIILVASLDITNFSFYIKFNCKIEKNRKIEIKQKLLRNAANDWQQTDCNWLCHIGHIYVKWGSSSIFLSVSVSLSLSRSRAEKPPKVPASLPRYSHNWPGHEPRLSIRHVRRLLPLELPTTTTTTSRTTLVRGWLVTQLEFIAAYAVFKTRFCWAIHICVRLA